MIIIPARLASTRLKNKILCDIFGVPMFIATAQNGAKVDEVVIAVDDEQIYAIAQKYGFRAVMTSKEHQSGTDRINEAVQKLGLDADEVIINIQADEPFFETANLKSFRDFASNSIAKGAFMASCYKNVVREEADDPNLVKVVTDTISNALYFSRSLIPYPREDCHIYKAHIGIYAYSVKSLSEFCSFSYSQLEHTEKLEQLRALQNGKKIAMMELETQSIGIDCELDLARALNKFKGA